MKTISIAALKGGVAKTISAINIAYILNATHGKRILLIDCDKQGNTSKFFGLHSYKHPSLADLLTNQDYRAADVMRPTEYSGLDLIPANMNLLKANKEILIDSDRPQQTRLRAALEDVNKDYDYVIIDNAPDLDMCVTNALVACDDVLIPVKIDRFSLDGLDILQNRVEDLKAFNPKLKIAGCFATMFRKSNLELLSSAKLDLGLGFSFFNTVIRRTDKKVDESTFTGEPLEICSPRSGAARDYKALVTEYLESR